MPIHDCPHCKGRIWVQTGYPHPTVTCPECGKNFDHVTQTPGAEVVDAYKNLLEKKKEVSELDQLYLEKERQFDKEWAFGNVDERDQSCVSMYWRLVEYHDGCAIPSHGISINRGLYEAGDCGRRLNNPDDALIGWEAYQDRRRSWYKRTDKLKRYEKYRRGYQWEQTEVEEDP